MPVYVNNLQEKVKVDSKLLEALPVIVDAALKAEGRDPACEVSIALVDDNYIRELNARYRGIDKSTDVLSFPMAETVDDEPEIADEEGEDILGDIVISMETAQRQAEEFGHPLLREMGYLLTHGVFHLLGYDHENEQDKEVMRVKEEQVLTALNITR